MNPERSFWDVRQMRPCTMIRIYSCLPLQRFLHKYRDLIPDIINRLKMENSFDTGVSNIVKSIPVIFNSLFRLAVLMRKKVNFLLWTTFKSTVWKAYDILVKMKLISYAHLLYLLKLENRNSFLNIMFLRVNGVEKLHFVLTVFYKLHYIK